MQPSDPEEKILCDLCGKDITWEDWFGLHKWVINATDSFTMRSEGEVWDLAAGRASMRTLCSVGCLSMWLEAALVEAKKRGRR